MPEDEESTAFILKTINNESDVTREENVTHLHQEEKTKKQTNKC